MKINETIKQVKNFAMTGNGLLAIMLAAALAVMMWQCGGDGSAVMTAAVILPGAVAGKHVAGAPLTTTEAVEASPGLLRSEIDERIVKIRPMSTPLDQISRYGGTRHAGSMKVEFYAVDTKPAFTALAKECSATSGTGNDGFSTAQIRLVDPDIVDETDTLLLPGVKNKEGECIVLYVIAKSNTGVTVAAANNPDSGGVSQIPALQSGEKVVRMGRAAGELDVQTAQYEALPQKRFNYCQIFKAQVEQSTLMKLANKEAGWTFSDQEEAAIVDMRLGMERNYLFGSRCRVYDTSKREHVHLTGGIWNQVTRKAHYTPGELDHKKLVEMSRLAFTDNAGSSRKILIGGTALVEQLHNLEHYKVIGQGGSLTRWGLDFSEIRTKFGTLYVISSEIFDSCGHANDGLVIDPEYVTKYTHIPFRTERLDLRSSGVRNTDAVVITEASCLVLRYPSAHMRIEATE